MASYRLSDLNVSVLIIVFILIIVFLIAARYANPPVRTVTKTVTSMTTITTTSPVTVTNTITSMTATTSVSTTTVTQTVTVTTTVTTSVSSTVTQTLIPRSTINVPQQYAILFSGNQYFILPQCNVTSNPYGPENLGTYGLLNCIAMTYGALTIISRFYLPPSGSGVILGIYDSTQAPSAYTPLLYVSLNGSLLVFGDYTSGLRGSYMCKVIMPVRPGWHTVIAEEYYSSGDYWLMLGVDGHNGYCIVPYGNIPQLFGLNGPYPFSAIGVGYTGWWPYTPGDWFFFNGYIEYIALYGTVLNNTQISEVMNGELPARGLVALYLANNYNQTTGIWYETVNGLNATAYGNPLKVPAPG